MYICMYEHVYIHVYVASDDELARILSCQIWLTLCFLTSESSLLKSDKDKYWISPCKVEKGVMWVVLEVDILKCQLAIICAMDCHCRADC